jgi:hypothetical protein
MNPDQNANYMITVLSALGCVLAMSSNWLVCRGELRSAFRLGIITGSCYVALDVILAVEGNTGVILLAIPAAWGILTSILGLRRLKGEEWSSSSPLMKTATCAEKEPSITSP